MGFERRSPTVSPDSALYRRSIEAADADLPAVMTSEIAETYVLVDGQTLLVSVDGAAADTATFETADFGDIGAATAAEVAAVIATDITGASAAAAGGKVVITNDGDGSTSTLEVTGGTANPVLGFTEDVEHVGVDAFKIKAHGINMGHYRKASVQVTARGTAVPVCVVRFWNEQAGEFTPTIPATTATGPGAAESFSFDVDCNGRVMMVEVTGGVAAAPNDADISVSGYELDHTL